MNPAFRILSFTLCLLALSAPAQAAGFYLQEQSVAGQGTAYAGAQVMARDASVMFYNPAGITNLETRTATVSASVIKPGAQVRDGGTTAGLTAGAQAPRGGNNGGDPYGYALIPDIYVASPLPDDRYWVGLGITAPFGLANNYGAGWFGRYDSTKSKLTVINVSPVFAAQITDRLSLGFGPDFQYASGNLQSALPCPSVGLGCASAFTPATDGLSKLDGSGFAVGYNAGILWAPDSATKIGAFYRSAVTQDVRGAVTVSGLTGALAGNNSVRAAQAKLKLPDIASLGVSRGMGDRLTLLGSVSWYGWKKFDAIRVRFDNGNPDSVTREDYHDSWSAALGAEWKQDDDLTLRAGTQFDQTPTTSSRTTRTPDASRAWLSFGAGYKVNQSLTLDAAATHIFMGNSTVTVSDAIYAGTGAATTVNMNARLKGSIDILSLQAVVRF